MQIECLERVIMEIWKHKLIAMKHLIDLKPKLTKIVVHIKINYKLMGHKLYWEALTQIIIETPI